LFRTLFEGPVGIILIAIIIAIFAGPKLPKAAKGIAESIKVFKKEIKTDERPSDNSDSTKKSDD
jgi:sec-independent protein translocase protein TatA